MRRFGSLLICALVVVACGGSSGDSSTPTTKPQNVRAAVTRAQLVVEDLGGDWKLTATDPPGNSATADEALGACVGKKLDVVEQTEVESETRTFERGSDTQQQQVVSSSAGFDSTDRVRQLFDVVGSTRFANCMASAFEDKVKAEGGPEGGLSLDAGTPTVVRPAVAGADHSVHITSDVKVHIDALTLDGRFDVVLLGTGRVVSTLLGFSVGDPIPAPQLVHLTQLLLERQHD